MRDRLVFACRSFTLPPMRKRLVIGAIAAVVIGVAACMLSQPRAGSNDWHEREYWSLRKGGSELVSALRWAVGMGAASLTQEESARLYNHESVLIKNGRLVERIVLVSNQPPNAVLSSALRAILALGPMQWESDVVFFEGAITNGIRLVTRTNDAAARLSRWEALIRQADFPLTN